MRTENANATLVIQGGPATTRPAQSAPAVAPTTTEDVQSLRDQIRQLVRAQIAAGVKGATPASQASPATPRTITIRAPDGTQTVVDMPPHSPMIGVPPYDPNDVIPPQAVEISIAFFVTIAAIIIGLPLARAFARRMDRKSTGTQIPGELSTQLAQLNQSVDAIALEVERISEGQRFTTRLLSEQRDAARQTLPSGANR